VSPSDAGDGPAERHRSEAVAAVLLALAAVATAWSSYQASRWTGEQAQTFSAANASRVESTRASDLAHSQTQVDIATFIEWVDAHLAGDGVLATFYERRFRDEFRPAFGAWLTSDPFTNRSAPPSPFAMAEYRLDAADQAARLEMRANALAEEARVDVQRATNYVLGVVLFAIVLFCAGVGSKVGSERARRIVLGVGALVFLVAAAWIATFPISLSI
jgi:hypothetical protein